MSEYQTFNHRVRSWTEKDGELHLMHEQYDPIVEKWHEVFHQSANMMDEAFRQELRLNGWLEPEIASQVLECLESLGVRIPEDDPARQWARHTISKAKGEQG